MRTYAAKPSSWGRPSEVLRSKGVNYAEYGDPRQGIPPTVFVGFTFRTPIPMANPKSIKELLQKGGQRLSDLNIRSRHRTMALKHVAAALPPDLVEFVVSAGLDQGRLTVGVAGAPWAARLRYGADRLRREVSQSMGKDINHIRIKVVPPRS